MSVDTDFNYQKLITEIALFFLAFAINKAGDFGKQYGVLLMAVVYFGIAYDKELKPYFSAFFQPSDSETKELNDDFRLTRSVYRA